MELVDQATRERQARDALTVLVISLALNPLGKVDPQAQDIVTDLIDLWTKKGLAGPEIETLLLWMQKHHVSGVRLVQLLNSPDGGDGSMSALARYILEGPSRTVREERERQAEAIRDRCFTKSQVAFAGTEDPEYTFMVLAMHEWAIRSLQEAGLDHPLAARQTIVDGVIAKWAKSAQELHERVVLRGREMEKEAEEEKDETQQHDHPLFDILDTLGVEYEESTRAIRETIIRDLAVSMSEEFTDGRARTDPKIRQKMLNDISTVIGSVFNKSAQSTPLRSFVIMQLCSLNSDISQELLDYYGKEKEHDDGWRKNYEHQIEMVTEFYKKAIAIRSSRKKSDRKKAVAPLIGLALTCRFDQMVKICTDHGFVSTKKAQEQEPEQG